MQGLNFVFICLLISSFIFVRSIASYDATSCRQLGISSVRVVMSSFCNILEASRNFPDHATGCIRYILAYSFVSKLRVGV